MGGKRHKGVGFNRPKKKKVLAVEEVSIEAEESEDEPDLTQGPAPEPRALTAAIARASPADAR